MLTGENLHSHPWVENCIRMGFRAGFGCPWVGYNMIPISILSLFCIYSYRYNYLRFVEHVMVIWNLLDCGLSHKGPFIGPFKFLRSGTPVLILINNPQVLGKWVDAGWSGSFLSMTNLPSTQFSELSTLAWNCWAFFHRIDRIGAPYRCTY
jgi:hypothetical protein